MLDENMPEPSKTLKMKMHAFIVLLAEELFDFQIVMFFNLARSFVFNIGRHVKPFNDKDFMQITTLSAIWNYQDTGIWQSHWSKSFEINECTCYGDANWSDHNLMSNSWGPSLDTCAKGYVIRWAYLLTARSLDNHLIRYKHLINMLK